MRDGALGAEGLGTRGGSRLGISAARRFEDESGAAVTDALDKFKPTFQTSDGQLLAGKEETEAMDSENVEQEQIVKQKRG